MPEPNSGCWLWVGSCDRNGYGQIREDKNTLKYASHISLRIHGIDTPTGMGVLHKCDNPPCVNPDHLFVGNQKANMADAKAKNRMNLSGLEKGRGYKTFGPRPWFRKFTAEEVRLIRTSDLSSYMLGKILDVSKTTIQAIRKRRSYQEIA
jgi:hypothetical protein